MDFPLSSQRGSGEEEEVRGGVVLCGSVEQGRVQHMVTIVVTVIFG
jgi:hypothetical protein